MAHGRLDLQELTVLERSNRMSPVQKEAALVSQAAKTLGKARSKILSRLVPLSVLAFPPSLLFHPEAARPQLAVPRTTSFLSFGKAPEIHCLAVLCRVCLAHWKCHSYRV